MWNVDLATLVKFSDFRRRHGHREVVDIFVPSFIALMCGMWLAESGKGDVAFNLTLLSQLVMSTVIDKVTKCTFTPRYGGKA